MREAITTKKAPQPVGTYSQAVIVDSHVYIAGQIALIPESLEMNNATIEAEVKQSFDNLAVITEAAGGSLGSVCHLTVYVTNIEYITVINEAMTEYFGEPYPARAVVQVSALPRGAKVEVSAIMAL